MRKRSRFLAFILVLLMVLSPLALAEEEPAALTLADLQAQYPHGMYWNGGDPLSYTDTPCTHHGNCSKHGYDGWCGCNTFLNHAIQCMGYAFQIAALIYGGDPYLEWIPYYGEEALDTLEPGDIVRYKNHSIFVYGVDGDTVTFTDCNWNRSCNIRWDQTITKEELRENFKYVNRAPYAWGEGTATCGCSVDYAGEYTCITENYPLNIRGGHGTSYKVIGEIPIGATVTVSKAPGTGPDDWAHVEYNGIRGYASLAYLKNNHQHFYAGDCDTACDCGELREPVAEHTFGEYVYNEDATYLIDGTKTRSCEVCQEIETITAEGSKLPNPFADVAAESYSYDAVLWALEQKITTGTAETKFSPTAACLREQIVTFLWRAKGKPKAETENPFTDVPEGSYYADAVLWAVKNNITKGTGETTFAPQDLCTRGQIVTFLWRTAECPAPTSAEHPFTDIAEDAFYYDAVLWAVENGITTGVEESSFAPDDSCTREQIVTFLYRCFYQTEETLA